MSSHIYLKLTSGTHGAFPGTTKQKGFEDQIPVSNTYHQVEKNPGTKSVSRAALSVGPYLITKKIDKTSPMFFLSWRLNDKFSEFRLGYYRPKSSGVFTLDYSVELYDARIIKIEQVMVSADTPDLPERETVSFEFGKMVLRYEDGGYEAEILTTPSR